MGKSNTGTAAADALARVLGVYLTTSAREKDRNLDQQRWQAQFELDKKRSEVEMQRAAREQALFDKQLAEDQDIGGILSSLQSQGVTPPSGIDTRRELTSWLNMQNDIQDAADKKKKSEREDEMFPLEKARVKAETDAANRRGTERKKPETLRDWLPDFMQAEFDMVDNALKNTNKEFETKKAQLYAIDDMDPEAGKKKQDIAIELDRLQKTQVMLGQRMGEMGNAVIKEGVQTPEQWDAYNQKLETEHQAEKQKTAPIVAPKESGKSENAPGFRDPNAQSGIAALFKGLVDPGTNPFLPNDQGPTVAMPDVQMLTAPKKDETKPKQDAGSLLNAAAMAAIRSGKVPAYQTPGPTIQPTRFDVIRQFLLGQNGTPYGN